MSRQITFTPPEGVPISFTIASLGSRLGAQLLDLLLTWAFAIAVVLLIAWLELIPWHAFGTLLTLIAFFLRVPYYLLSELVWNGRTLGKRMTRLRVISADGRRLTPWQIAARNLMKEVEFFTPATMLIAAGIMALGPIATTIAVVWGLAVYIVPLTNKRRQRLGDMIAGTVVVDAPKAVLLPDMARQPLASAVDRFVFQPHQLDIYGRLELQTLEEILRTAQADPKMVKDLTKVVEAITTKIQFTERLQPADQLDFLQAFYRAQREHLESRRLFGDRREDKFHAKDLDATPAPKTPEKR